MVSGGSDFVIFFELPFRAGRRLGWTGRLFGSLSFKGPFTTINKSVRIPGLVVQIVADHISNVEMKLDYFKRRKFIRFVTCFDRDFNTVATQ